MKKCPFCFEEIQEKAIKCRFCGERLNECEQESNQIDSNNNPSCKICRKRSYRSEMKVADAAKCVFIGGCGLVLLLLGTEFILFAIFGIILIINGIYEAFRKIEFKVCINCNQMYHPAEFVGLQQKQGLIDSDTLSPNKKMIIMKLFLL